MRPPLKNFPLNTLFSLGFIALAAILPYLYTLDAPFVYDDLHTIVNNPPLRYHSSTYDFFRMPELFSGTKAEMYRPINQISYMLNFRLGGSGPEGFRLFNLLIHLLCAWLVFWLSRLIPGLEKASLLAALLFALHPVQTETVIYLSSRSTLLASFFILLGLIAFIHATEAERSPLSAWLIGLLASLCLIAGLASKAIAVTLPALALAYLVLFPTGRKSRGLVIVSLLFMISGLYVLLRHALGLYTFFPPELVRPLSTNLLTQTRVTFHYLRILLMPIHLSLENDMAEIQSPFHPWFLLSILGWLAILCLGLARARRYPVILFSILFFIIALIPTSTLIPLVVIASENRLYLASLGLIWPVSMLFLLLLENQRARAGGIVFILFILACFFCLTLSRGAVWGASERLWRDAVTKAPLQARAHVNYGIELKKQGHLRAAVREYQMALRLDPRNTWAYNNLGNIYFDQGQYDAARKAYERAVEIAPGNINACLNLGHLLVAMGDPEGAAALLEKAVSIAPFRADTRHDLGIVYLRYLGDWNKACEQLERSLELDPGQKDAEKIRRAIGELRMPSSIQGEQDQRAR